MPIPALFPVLRLLPKDPTCESVPPCHHRTHKELLLPAEALAKDQSAPLRLLSPHCPLPFDRQSQSGTIARPAARLFRHVACAVEKR
jgi:hypothetical protein